MRQRGWRWFAAVAASLLTGALSPAYAQFSGEEIFGPAIGLGATDAPVEFSGDVFTWDRDRGVISGTGHVEIEQGARRITADEITLFLDKGVAELRGNVAVSQDGQTVYGDTATYDLVTQAGTFERPRGALGPWYVQADDIVRDSPTLYRARDAQLSSCELVPPHWSIGVGDLIMDREANRVRGTNVVGRVGRVPVFYAPVYSQRLDRRRPPIKYKVGYESDVGVFARVGFPLDVTDTVELQPNIDLFSKSGIGGGLSGDGTLFDGNTAFATDLWYVNDLNKDNTDGPGITADRHKMDFYGRSELPDDWVALTQVEWLSDSRVLKTFFWDDFRERETPESLIDFTRTKPHTILQFGAEKRLDDFTQTIDDLPRASVDLLEYQLFDSPVYISAHADGAYRELKPRDDHVTVSRQEVRLAAPYRVAPWLNTVPFVEVEGRYHDAGNVGTRDSDFSSWVRPGVVLQSRFHAPFDSPIARYERMRHLLEPTVTYAYRTANSPDVEDRLFFDRSLLSLDENSLEVELRNIIQGRRPDGRIENFLEYRVTLDGDFADGQDHLARLENEVIFRPHERWTLTARSLHDLRRERRASSVAGRIKYTDRRHFDAHVGMIYADSRGPAEPRSEVTYGLATRLFNDDWRAGFQHRLLEDEGRLEQQEYWVWRRFHCWELIFSVTDRRESTTFMFEIGLTAFPNRGFRNYRDESLLHECNCDDRDDHMDQPATAEPSPGQHESEATPQEAEPES